MTEYGLIGRVIGHSYSAIYFNDKFEKENIDAHYSLFPLATIDLFPKLLDEHPNLVGLNVTIPYKVEVMQYLNALSEEAEGIGAVNVIKISQKDGKRFLKGYNSDAYGFTESLKQVLATAGTDNRQPTTDNRKPKTDNRQPTTDNRQPKTALVLGTGGASRAVDWSLRKLGFTPQLVGRKEKENCISYEMLTPQQVNEASIVVNCTPLGTSPDVDKAAPFPYQYLHEGQVCFDLVYNPAETLFMRLCKAHGCKVSNGLEMLRLQAVGAWRIWNNKE